MEQQPQQPQTQEKPKKSVWKKWWFWLIIIVIILIGGIIISDHVAKVNDCKKRCTYHITQEGEGIWSYPEDWGETKIDPKTGLEWPKHWGEIVVETTTGYSTREECIEGCILNTDWAK